MRPWKAAVCQMDSQMDRKENLAAAEGMIRQAAEEGAILAAFPENVTYMGRGYRKQAEPADGESMSFFQQEAKANRIWVMTGSFPEADPSGKPKNTLLLIDPDGQVRAKYSKIHLFDMSLEGQVPQLESSYVTGGDGLSVCETDLGCLGFSICYDIRFGELYRLLALNGAQVIFVPASFTRKTGEMHWKTLLRARAIENGAYIIAPDQCGRKTNMHAHGHSMIIDPWGQVIAEAGGDDPEIVYAEIDPEECAKARAQIGSLKNRRPDVYQLAGSVRKY